MSRASSRCARAALALLLGLLAPARALGQAEQAPEDYVPPAQRELPPEEREGRPELSGPHRLPADQPRWHVSVSPRLAVRLGDGPPKLPLLGGGGGVSVSRALLPVGRWLRFGVGIDFAFDRFSRRYEDPMPGGTQSLSHATFAPFVQLDGLFGRLRPFVAVGGGLSIAAYNGPPDDPSAQPYSLVAPVGLVHLAAGLGVRLLEGFELGVRAESDLTFSSARAQSALVFQPGLFAAALDLGFRF